MSLKLLIKKLQDKFIPPSTLDGILEEGFISRPDYLGEDLELYVKGNERIVYNGRTDKVIKRYQVE